jgi:predicted metal-dependent phosphoesterase TrpH
MPLIDLHLHSNYSDGQDNLDKLFRLVTKTKIAVFSVTDHNYIHKLSENLLHKIKKGGVKFIQGVEVSSFDNKTGTSFHILGYSEEFDTHRLNVGLDKTMKGYNDRAKKIIKKLNNKYRGLNLDYFDLKKRNPEVYISRNTIAVELKKFLKSKATIKELSREAFVEEESDWMLSPLEAINLITDSCGIAVLAHPGRLFSKDQKKFENTLKSFKRFGLKGIEVYNPKHTKEEVSGLLRLSRKYKLLATAGSDWHGAARSSFESPGVECTKQELSSILACLF